MNFELKRLETFRSWPQDAPIAANKIAKAGFFYLGTGTSVQCFSCEGVISRWNTSDQVIVRHRALNPSCDFILNKSNNVHLFAPQNDVPLLTSPQNQKPPDNAETMYHNPRQRQRVLTQKVWTKFSDLMQVNERVKTFVGWSVAFMDIHELAAAGFFYLKDRDRVQCIYCDGIVGDWEVGDVPLNEHRRHFPRCPLFVGEDVPERQPRSQPPAANHGHQTANPRENSVPTSPRYATLEERLRSFTKWPLSIPQPQDLAAAGFYYTGFTDHVRCFSCDGGLRNWEPGDDCWLEHARCFGRCRFLLLMKGQEFVDDILRSDSAEYLQASTTVENGIDPAMETSSPAELLNPIYKLQPSGEKAVNATDPAMVSEEPSSQAESLESIFKLQPAREKVGSSIDPAMVSHEPSSEAEPLKPIFKLQPAGEKVENATGPAVVSQEPSSEAEALKPIFKLQPAGEKVENATDPAMVSQEPLLQAEPLKPIFKLQPAGEKVLMESKETSAKTSWQPDEKSMHRAENSSISENGSTVTNSGVVQSQGSLENNEESGLHPTETAAQQESPVVLLDDTKGANRHTPITNVEDQAFAAEPEDKINELVIPSVDKDPAEANADLGSDKDLCKICLDKPLGMVFVPCGHLVSCMDCASKCKDCPMCRRTVESSMRTYLS